MTCNYEPKIIEDIEGKWIKEWREKEVRHYWVSKEELRSLEENPRIRATDIEDNWADRPETDEELAKFMFDYLKERRNKIKDDERTM